MRNVIFLLSCLFIASCSKEPTSSTLEALQSGAWQLKAIVNDQNDTTIAASDPKYYDPATNEAVAIIMDFNEGKMYQGSTSRNTFEGRFSCNDSQNTLVFSSLNCSEATETELGDLFFDKLVSNYGHHGHHGHHFENEFVMHGDTLTIYCAGSYYLRFNRI
jgi:hypothetical protein